MAQRPVGTEVFPLSVAGYVAPYFAQLDADAQGQPARGLGPVLLLLRVTPR